MSGWADFGARWGLLDIGRWHAVDPLAGEYVGWSPFSAMLNNPIRFIDPDGNYVISAAFAEKYKIITKYLQSHIQADVMGNERILSAMRIESQGNLEVVRDFMIERE